MSAAYKSEEEGFTKASDAAPRCGRVPHYADVPAAPTLSPLAYFGDMVDHCYEFAQAAKSAGRPVVGIMCEFTPRELILAAGGVPVCLCGGSGATVGAAEQALPTNLCPLIKSTFGYHLKRSNPFLEMADLVVAETTCDGKKKMFELMGETRPMAVLALPHQSEESQALSYWTEEVRRLKTELEKRFLVTITHDRLRSAVLQMNQERSLRRQLSDFMAAASPPLTGRQLLEFKSIISAIPADLEQYQLAIHQLSAGAAAPGSLRAQPQGRAPVRVLLTGVPMVHGAEHVLEWIEGCGAVVVCQENCTGLKPILEDIDPNSSDLIRAIAEKYFHLPCSIMTPNRRRLQTLRDMAAKFRPACVIELVWQACLTYDVESARTRRLAEEELGLPYLKIVTDYSRAEAARVIARVEATLELVRAQAPPGPIASKGALHA